MLRSLHMKLVMIMVLLILSLMTVVGTFLINSVMAFYLEDFYTQMSRVFDQNMALSRNLETAVSAEEDGCLFSGNRLQGDCDRNAGQGAGPQ